ncbi:flippase-like domain-containing protein [Archaeoglobus sp.]
MKVSVILPAYNEAESIENAVKTVKSYLEKLGYDYEIIIAEDGSTDGTDKIARRLAEKDERIVHLHSDERLGRGKALTNAIKRAKGEIVAYLDVDLSTDMEHFKELVEAISNGYDIATGSRLMKESRAERPLKRDIASRVYNILVRFMLGSKLRDHQCGFKAFKKSSILPLLEKVKDNHWFWDTELLVLAQREGLKVKEIPVRWKQGRDTKVRFKRDVLYMFSQILRMWIESKRSKKFIAVSTLASVSIIVALAYFSGFSLKDLLSLNPLFLGVASVIYLSTFLVRGYRFEYILRKVGFRVPTLFSSEGVAVSQMVNVVTPARIGDVVRAYVFKLKNVPISSCLSALAVERIFDLFAVVILSLVSATFLGSFVYMREIAYAVVIGISIIIAVLIFSKMENIVGRMSKDVKTALHRGFPVLITLSILNWLMDVATCYVIGLPFNANLFSVMLAVAIANIVKAIPITPGGIGTYEAVVTGILTAFGLSSSEAFTIALVDHTIKNLITLVLGYVSIIHLNVKIRDIA